MLRLLVAALIGLIVLSIAAARFWARLLEGE